MTNANPLNKYFRQPSLFMRLPTQGKWYAQKDVELSGEGEIPVFGLTALDEIMLNTPDAMLNGQALENVIKNCSPSIKNVKNLMIPDLDALFLAIKIATSNGKYDFERKCPSCGHDNTFEVNCQHLLDTMTVIEDTDAIVNFNEQLIVHVRPYTLEMRQLFLQREFEEERTLKAIDESNKDLNEFERAKILGESVERLSKITFTLVAKSIEKIVMVSEKVSVTDPAHINEWLTSINKAQADAVMNAVNNLNSIGVTKSQPAQCESCGHQWTETLNFDPISFFGQR